jgi:hypothetical protein
MKQKDWSEIQMHPIEQPTQAEVTKAQDDPKGLTTRTSIGEASLFLGAMTSRFVSRRLVEWHELRGVLDPFVARIGALNSKGWQT